MANQEACDTNGTAANPPNGSGTISLRWAFL